MDYKNLSEQELYNGYKEARSQKCGTRRCGGRLATKDAPICPRCAVDRDSCNEITRRENEAVNKASTEELKKVRDSYGDKCTVENCASARACPGKWKSPQWTCKDCTKLSYIAHELKERDIVPRKEYLKKIRTDFNKILTDLREDLGDRIRKAAGEIEDFMGETCESDTRQANVLKPTDHDWFYYQTQDGMSVCDCIQEYLDGQLGPYEY